jgi:hypothetical protein
VHDDDGLAWHRQDIGPLVLNRYNLDYDIEKLLLTLNPAEYFVSPYQRGVPILHFWNLHISPDPLHETPYLTSALIGPCPHQVRFLTECSNHDIEYGL